MKSRHLNGPMKSTGITSFSSLLLFLFSIFLLFQSFDKYFYQQFDESFSSSCFLLFLCSLTLGNDTPLLKFFCFSRTRKISVNNLYAFDSPNCVPLVEVGIDFEVNKKAIFKPNVIEKCHLHAKMSKNVGLLRIFPSLSSSVIKAFCQPPIEGTSKLNSYFFHYCSLVFYTTR